MISHLGWVEAWLASLVVVGGCFVRVICSLVEVGSHCDLASKASHSPQLGLGAGPCGMHLHSKHRLGCTCPVTAATGECSLDITRCSVNQIKGMGTHTYPWAQQV